MCSSSSLLKIKQGENKSLRAFISRFNKEALLVDLMGYKILLVAFYNRFTSNLFIYKLCNWEPQTMAELIHSAQSFMKVEDVIIAKWKKKVGQAEAGYMHIQNKALIQRRLKWEKRETEMARRSDRPKYNTQAIHL